MSAFFMLASLSRSGVVSAGPFPVCAHRVLGFAFRSQARQGIKPNRVSVRTDRHARLPLLSTPSYDDAVTVGFQPVEHLVESVSTSSSDALSGARAPASRRLAGGRPRPGRGRAPCAKNVRLAMLGFGFECPRPRRDAAWPAGGTPGNMLVASLHNYSARCKAPRDARHVLIRPTEAQIHRPRPWPRLGANSGTCRDACSRSGHDDWKRVAS